MINCNLNMHHNQGRILWATKAITEAHVLIENEGEPKYFIICICIFEVF